MAGLQKVDDNLPAGGVRYYLAASERDNTLRSYASALRHFEEEWKGLLPSTPDLIARYLADYAGSLSVATLRLRLAALSRWHTDQGFADPTKSALVRQVLKGIRAVHPAVEKRARPLELEVLDQVDRYLANGIAEAETSGRRAPLFQHTRDRSLLLLGFWRGFRSDELVNLQWQHLQLTPGEGLRLRVLRSKADRSNQGRDFLCPALTRLCPVAAFQAWQALAGQAEGAVFRKVDRWGSVGAEALHANSVIALLRRLFQDAGVVAPEAYSSHSLRRGFAGWARDSGWDIQELMAYVGWKDVKSAMRYLDTSTATLQARFEHGLRGRWAEESPPVVPLPPERPPRPSRLPG